MNCNELTPEWREHLSEWVAVVGPDLPIQFYKHDGTDSPDVWADGPHLAVSVDVHPGRTTVWPVDVDGWANPRDIGWQGVIALIACNART